MPGKQKAVFVTALREPLSIGERDIPTPNSDQVLIKVTAAMVLPHDTYGWNFGLYVGDRLPYIFGSNIAGKVVTVGSEVTGFEVDDLVFGEGDPTKQKPDNSGLQEYAILDGNSLAKVPKGFTDDQMVTFPVNAMTSFKALFDSDGFGFPAPYDTVDKDHLKNETILIFGGGSNAGKLAIQFARLAGVGKILTIASGSRTKELQELGVTHVIDRHQSQDEVVRQVQEIVGDGGLDKVYDCVSWDFTFPLALLTKNKKVTLLGLHPTDKAAKQAEEKGLDARVQFIRGLMSHVTPKIGEGFWKHFPDWVEQGEVKVSNFKVVGGLEDIAKIEEGLKSYADGSPVVPIIVRP